MQLDYVITIDRWTALLAAGLVVFSVAAYRRTAPPLSAPRRALLRSLRAASFFLLVLLVVNPVVVSTRAERRRPLVLVMLDRSRSMGIRDEGRRSRLDVALEDAANLRRELSPRGIEVVVLPFGGALADAPLPPEGVCEADGDGTDIRGAIAAARDRYPEGIAAVVLLTDGRVTRGMISQTGAPHAPVFAVGYGDTAVGADISIEEVIADRIAYRGTVLRVEAAVRAEGCRGSSVEVRLLEDGKPKSSTSLAVRRDSEILGVAFDYLPEREGFRRLTIEAVGARSERNRDNNVESARIDVRADKIRLLFLDYFADWNTAFLRDLEKRSNRIDADVVHRSSDEALVLDPGGTPWTFPAVSSGLASYALVIIADDGGLFAERSNAEALIRYVEDGGSVLFLAGEGSPVAREASFGLLERVLPVRRTGALGIEYVEGCVKASESATGDPFVAALGPQQAFAAMPPLPARIAGVAANAGARVPIVFENGGRKAFLAIDRRGDGLSAAVLGFPLWRWKLAGGTGAGLYESFLGAIVHYLAEGAKAPPLAFDADRAIYRSGDRVKLAASIGGREASGSVRGELRRAGEGAGKVIATFMFEPDARRPGVYRAMLDGLAPGDYRVDAVESAPGARGPSGSIEFSVEALSVEFIDTSRDGSFLARTAAETGGAYIERSALAATVAERELAVRTIETKIVRDLRGGMLGFIALVALLGAEWILRKTWGLV